MNPIERLPLAARRRLAALEDEANDADARARANYRAIDAAERQLGPLENIRASDPSRALEAQVEIDALNADIERLKAQTRARNHAAGIKRQIVVRVRNWLMTLPPHVKLEMVATPKPSRTVTGAQAIEPLREQIERLQEELFTISRAPLPADDLKAKARALVEDFAREGRPLIATDPNHPFSIKWRRREASSPSGTPDDFMKLVAWMQGDLVIKRLENEIDAVVGQAGVSPLSEAERAKRTKELEAEILQAERLEEALIANAPDVLRRPDADSRALLGVQVVSASASRAA
jgi:hypothetical protein